MPTLKLEIRTDNDAFADGPHELGRILIELGQAVQARHMPGSVRDVNGNMVGTITYA